MPMLTPTRRTLRTALVAAASCALLLGTASAQVSGYADKQMGENRGDELPQVLTKVTTTQHLNAQLPLNAQFVDETGKPVALGTYFNGEKPGILSLVYFDCPMLCSEELDGITASLEMVKLTPGKDFNIVIVSIDPNDTPEKAAAKKAFYLKRYGHPETASGWHFLTTTNQAAIDSVTNTVGFGYVKVPGPDGKLTQFAHASSIQIVTPEGKLSQYYLGVEYSAKDILLGLTEASGNKIGSPVVNILTYCYHYDPSSNKHTVYVARVVQVGGMVTVAGLGGFIFLMFRRDLRLGRDHDLLQPTDDDDKSGAHKG